MATIDPPRAIRVKTSTGWADLAWKGAQGNTGAPGPAGPQGNPGQAGTGVTYKGTVPSSASLPPTGNSTGDAYVTTTDSHYWIWNGVNWCDNGVVAFPGATVTDFHRYKGTWIAGQYIDGDIVVYGGVVYLCVRPTTTTPAWSG